MSVGRTAPPRRVSAGCAPSGLALHLREHQGRRRCAQVLGDEDPGVRITFHMKGPDALRSARGFRAISAGMLFIRPEFARTLIRDRRRRDARERWAQLVSVALPT